MTIETNIEFANSRELRRRFVSALETGRLNLTGSEYEQWKPSVQGKIQEIDTAAGEYLIRLAQSSVNTVSEVYVACVSSAAAITPTQPQVISTAVGLTNVLTSPSPENVAPLLPFRT